MSGILKSFSRSAWSFGDMTPIFQRLISFAMVVAIFGWAYVMYSFLMPVLLAPSVAAAVAVAAYVRCCHQQEWSVRLALWWTRPTAKAWMATFTPAFTKAFPRWRDLVTSQTPHAPTFLALKAELERAWPGFKPELDDYLGEQADILMMTIEASSRFPQGGRLRLVYQTWAEQHEMLRRHQESRNVVTPKWGRPS